MDSEPELDPANDGAMDSDSSELQDLGAESDSLPVEPDADDSNEVRRLNRQMMSEFITSICTLSRMICSTNYSTPSFLAVRLPAILDLEQLPVASSSPNMSLCT